MKNKFILISIIFSCIGLVNILIYIGLVHFGYIVPVFSRYILNVVYIILIWVPIFLHLIFKIKFSILSIILYDVFIVCSVVIGSQYNIYDLLPLYDKAVHFSSGIIVAILFYTLLKNNSKISISTFWLFIFILSVCMLVGGVWEIYEFSYDSIAGANSQKWMGFQGHDVLNDSMFDLICDFTGGIIGAFIVIIIENKKMKKTSYTK